MLYLIFLKTCLQINKKTLIPIADRLYKKIPLNTISKWDEGYALLFLGWAYRNLNLTEQALDAYNRVIEKAENNYYLLLKSIGLTGLAACYRKKGDFKLGIFYHLESIKFLDEIGARCDLAEAYYQLALTYQKMGETEESQTKFQEAIRLFEEMEAPKQVEKVRKAMEGK